MIKQVENVWFSLMSFIDWVNVLWYLLFITGMLLDIELFIKPGHIFYSFYELKSIRKCFVILMIKDWERKNIYVVKEMELSLENMSVHDLLSLTGKSTLVIIKYMRTRLIGVLYIYLGITDYFYLHSTSVSRSDK